MSYIQYQNKKYDWGDVNDPDYKENLKKAKANADIDVDDEELFSLDLPTEVLQKIPPAKMRAANLYMTGRYTFKQIAAIIGVAPTTVSKWLRSPVMMDVVDQLQERDLRLSQEHLNSLREKAIDTMDKLLDSNMDNVRFNAAKDILDRSGMKAVNVSEVNKTVTTIDQQMADLAEFSIVDDDVIDIDLDEVMNETKTD